MRLDLPRIETENRKNALKKILKKKENAKIGSDSLYLLAYYGFII